MEKKDCSEIVVPNRADNPWPHPIGFPIILGDGKAYFIADISPSKRLDGVRVKFQEVNDAQKLIDDGGSPLDFLKKAGECALANLALQYDDDVLESVVETQALSARFYDHILLAMIGRPPYEVVEKKSHSKPKSNGGTED